ncbi:class I SAM-dependent methyltransferase [Variovorax sp. GT1P44]|uniref:class I SAM-dependent methyltransferase n=1 Tax=Variovorax sp. GT1P44 TaxID=3443742 RepID=UPI003F481014
MDPTDVARHWEANADAWTRQARNGFDIFRDALNTPAFLAQLPSVEGLQGLDVGCGEGSNTRQLARRGAKVVGVDIAPTFVRHARETESTEPLGIDFRVGDGMALPFDDTSFDFVTAFMSLMDMPDPQRALQEAHRVLRPGGFLQFSILHPCFVPPHRKVLRGRGGKARAIEIGNYFESTTGRVDTWWFSMLSRKQREKVTPFQTPIFHRTLSQWLDIVIGAGFVIEKVGEPTAGAAPRRREAVLDDTEVAPLSLIVLATRRRCSPPPYSLTEPVRPET